MLQPGQIIDGMYTIERMLGSGGMADVYIVKHVRLPKHFALKLMKLDGGERSQFLARFRREAEILGTPLQPDEFLQLLEAEHRLLTILSLKKK